MKYQRPTYLINPAICQSNIRNMADKASRSGVIFRPHFKTHQSIAIGRWFRGAGISCITVSSIGAAAYFAQDGWDDITVAFPVNLRETGLLNELASSVRTGVLLEHPNVAAELGNALRHPVDAYIKIDTGYHRTGLGPDEMPLIRQLVSVIQDEPMLSLKGLLTHAGQTYRASSAREVLEIYKESTRILNDIRDHLGSGYENLILSYGDTPSCSLVPAFDGVDEVRPGNFIFYDLMQLAGGVCQFSQVAGIAVCPVVAVHPSRNQAVLYGGAIHLSKESILMNGRPVYGQLVEMDDQGWLDPVPGAYLVSLSQEHGILEGPEAVIVGLRPGSVAGILPVHACLTANLIHGYRFLNGESADYFPGN